MKKEDLEETITIITPIENGYCNVCETVTQGFYYENEDFYCLQCHTINKPEIKYIY